MEWIPISNRLPDDNIHVLVWPGISANYPEITMALYLPEVRGFISVDGEDDDLIVTHWMPLPEGPVQ